MPVCAYSFPASFPNSYVTSEVEGPWAAKLCLLIWWLNSCKLLENGLSLFEGQGDIMARNLLLAALIASTVSCATLTEDAMTPIALSFSDGSSGNCHLSNKRGDWSADVPMTISVRKSDDNLKYQCETDDQRKAFGSIPSRMGGKIVASAVFIDFGITDAITDKHREYPPNFVIPIEKAKEAPAPSKSELVQQCVDACVKSSSKSADQCFKVCSD